MCDKQLDFSKYFQNLTISAIRQAQQCFSNRTDSTKAINASIGNVSLPIHPAMLKRLKEIGKDPELGQGIVKYTATSGREDTKRAFKKMISLCGAKTDDLELIVTNGGSQAMDLALLGCCQTQRPLIISEPTYSNYISIANSYKIPIVVLPYSLCTDGHFRCDTDLEEIIKKHNPSAILVIPYDNPTGKLLSQEEMVKIAKLCVKYNLWMISDEAYRFLHYTQLESPSIWKIDEEKAPGISKRRISIETVSKGLNGCGLRIGALVSDNKKFIQKAIISASSHLCAGAIGQYIVGGISTEKEEDLQKWYEDLRKYYQKLIISTTIELKKRIPKVIVSSPESALYSIVDLRNLVPKSFKIEKFCQFCAEKGKVCTKNGDFTLLFSPLTSFYLSNSKYKHYQLRLSYVASPEEIKEIPHLLSELLHQYLIVDKSTA